MNLAINPLAALFRVPNGTLLDPPRRMLQGVLAGRRTEIDAITGALLRMAARHGLAVPAHEALYHAVKALEPDEALLSGSRPCTGT